MKKLEGGAPARKMHGGDTVTTIHESVVNVDELKKILQEFTVVLEGTKGRSRKVEQKRQYIQEELARLQADFLRALGIANERTVAAWTEGDANPWEANNYVSFLSGHYALENMRRMTLLEEKSPGAVSYLYARCSIRNFARYSTDFWKRQYAERDSSFPYMLIITPSGIEKGTVAGGAIYSALQSDLDKLKQPHLMRVVEIYGLRDMLRLLVRLDETYNVNGLNPIKLVLFDGHGTNQRLFLSWRGKGSKFGAEDILSERFKQIFQKHLTKAFAATAQFVFGSCESALSYSGERSETGYRHMPGIAYSLKEVLREIFSKHVRIVGSEESLTPFTELKPSLRKDGSLSLACTTESYEETGERWRGESYHTIVIKTKRPRLKNL